VKENKLFVVSYWGPNGEHIRDWHRSTYFSWKCKQVYWRGKRKRKV